MPTFNTIVSYDSIARRFSSRDQLLATTHEAARHAIADPARVELRMGQFVTGLDALQEAANGFPRVFHTPRDPMGALLQTHVAAQAQQQNKLEEFLLHAVDGVKQFFEVRLSPQDWLGWGGSFFTWIEGIEKAKRPAAAAEAAAVAND